MISMGQCKNLSEQVFLKVHRDIETGIFKPGQKLPPERELETQYKVSRITINRALTKLKALGMIDRRQGAGTFVSTDRTGQSDRSARTLVRFISPGGERKGEVYVRMGVMEGILEVLEKDGIDVTVGFFYSGEDYLLQLAKFDRPDSFGMVVWYTPGPEGDALLLKMKEMKYPFVLVDHYKPDMESNHVVTDNIDGARQMVDYLAGKGHRRIVYVTPDQNYTSLQDRQAGFIKAMLSHQFPVTNSSVCQVARDDQESIRQTVRSVMNRSDAPTAIFAGTDQLAFSIYTVLKEMGLRVPDDISLAGYDNVDDGSYLEVPLTTVAQDFYKMGQLAGTLLKELNETKTQTYYHHLQVKPSLVERQSVGMVCVESQVHS
jgi:GntR family transcriptional regulator, arabinose operon transcriptional repressor